MLNHLELLSGRCVPIFSFPPFISSFFSSSVTLLIYGVLILNLEPSATDLILK